MNIEDLEAYSNAWNNHDIDTIMSYMTEDCIFETGAGNQPFGTRYEGYEDVKNRFIAVWKDIPDVRFVNAKHFIQDNRGCSEWRFVGHYVSGESVEIDGCDLFTFKENKIYIKNSFIKIKS